MYLKKNVVDILTNKLKLLIDVYFFQKWYFIKLNLSCVTIYAGILLYLKNTFTELYVFILFFTKNELVHFPVLSL